MCQNFNGCEMKRFVNLIASFTPVLMSLHQQHAVNPSRLLSPVTAVPAVVVVIAHYIVVRVAYSTDTHSFTGETKLEIATKIISNISHGDLHRLRAFNAIANRHITAISND